MSTIIAACYLWIFSIALVTDQLPLFVLAAAILVAAIWFFRKFESAQFLLIAFSGTVLVLVSNSFPLGLYLNLDWFESVRSSARESIVGLTSDSKSLVLGMAIGDDTTVAHSLGEAMRTTSLTHLIAVSGANCAIVVGLAYFLMYRLTLLWRVLVSMALLVGYVLLVGAQPSVLRAGVMAAAVMLAHVLGRQVNPLSGLATAVLFLLVASPGLSIDYGFVLSVLATAGILVLAPALHLRFSKRVPAWISIGLSVSLAAQLFCFPVLLSLQGGIPTYSLLANLLAEPLVAPITVLGLLGILMLYVPPLSGMFFWLASLPAEIVVQIAKTISSWPLTSLPWRLDGWGIIGAVVLSLAVLGILKFKETLHRNVASLVVAVLVACSIGVVFNQAITFSAWPEPNWQVVSCDVGQGDATVIRDSGSVAVIDVGRDEKKIDSCLSKLGVSRIDLLVLTHFDADHVAGLSGALHSRQVQLAMLTSFKDSRPGANFSKFQLMAANIPLITAERGLSGEMGRAKWQVLSPSKTAAEAEDSNDGSITMLWRFDDFKLITLADLGEKGQQRLAAELATWWQVDGLPLVMKVAHHGSADQYPELLEELRPEVALVSVGKNNGYGHPTRRTLKTLARAGANILRTDLLGSIALVRKEGVFSLSKSGAS